MSSCRGNYEGGKGDILLFHRAWRGEADIIGPSLCTQGVVLDGVEKLNVPFLRSCKSVIAPERFCSLDNFAPDDYPADVRVVPRCRLSLRG